MLIARLNRNLGRLAELSQDFAANVNGATAVEYGLIVGVICMAVLAGFTQLTGKLQDVFTLISNTFMNVRP